jgi:hypothetical protein
VVDSIVGLLAASMVQRMAPMKSVYWVELMVAKDGDGYLV